MGESVKVCSYETYADDFVESVEQAYKLPDDYVWIRDGLGWRVLGRVLYAIAFVFAVIYSKVYLRMRIVNCTRDGRGIGNVQGGCFVYANHTQPVGDPFIAGLAAFPKHAWAPVSAANLGIPVLGRALPLLGELPIPDSLRQMRDFNEALYSRANQGGAVFVYPEAHVWPWCTWIRPFPATSFTYPAKTGLPAYCMTVTYQKPRFGKRPRTTVYIDGPFLANMEVPVSPRRDELCQRVFSCMCERSVQSTYTYVDYVPKSGAPAKNPGNCGGVAKQ